MAVSLVVGRGEFQDLILQHQIAFEAYKRALEQSRSALPSNGREEARARAALRRAREELLIAIGVGVSSQI